MDNNIKKKHFKCIVKINLSYHGIDAGGWKTETENRSPWQKIAKNNGKSFKEKSIDRVLFKQSIRKQDMTLISDNLQPEHTYKHLRYGHLMQRAGLVSRLSQDTKQSQGDNVDSHP